MPRQILNETIEMFAQSVAQNPPTQPQYRDFTRRAIFHPLENTHPTKCNAVFEAEGREFKSLRARHFFRGTDYSYRRAIMGSTRMARRAGM